MADTTFSNGTVIQPAWLNDVNSQTYDKYINVKSPDYGAVGDGVTDDSAAIQAAIDDAVAIAGTGSYSSHGAAVYFPPGSYLVNTGLTLPSGGVGLFGDPGRSPRIVAGTSGMTVLKIGDDTYVNNTWEVHIENLFFQSDSLETTSTIAIQMYDSFGGTCRSVIFRGFYESVVCDRANRWEFINCRSYQNRATNLAASTFRFYGNSGGSGGGIHITDCELAGGGTLEPSVTAHIHVQEIDGLYVTNTHTRDCTNAVLFSPTGATGKNIVDSAFFTNCYFDENHGIPVRITGTVAGSGRYQFIHFNNCYWRGTAGSASNAVRIDVTSSAFTNELKSIQFNGGAMRQCDSTALDIRGSGSGFVEAKGVIVTGVHFEENNYGNASAISAISAECETITVSNCVFSADENASTQCVRINTSLLDTNKPSFVVTDNDFSQANCTGAPVTYTLAASGARFVLAHNTFVGLGKVINQQYDLTTTDATPTAIWTYAIPTGCAGYVQVQITGSTTDGANYAVYTWDSAFKRDSGTATLGGSDPVAGKAYKSGSMGTPSFALSTNTLTATVTGIAATTVQWTCRVMLSTNR